MYVFGLFDLIIIERQELEIHVSVTLNSSHALFNGHFPGNPVVPGVLLVQLATEAYGDAVGLSLKLSMVEQAKFLVPIYGKEDQILHLIITELEAIADEKRIDAKLSNQDQLCCKFKLKLK